MSYLPPLFNCGLELATLVVSSGLVDLSWYSISQLYRELNPNEQISFRVYQKPKCTVIAFVTSPTFAKHCLQEEDELVWSASLPQFHFLCTKSSPAFAIHKAAVTLFVSLLDKLPDLTTWISNLVPIIVTGHSLGGSVASLFTLWLLQSMNRRDIKRVLCITFGAPLIGDKGLQQAISCNSKWNSCFLHVVTNQDLVPRLFLGPQNPNSMQVDSGAVAYQPLGTFLFCSETGYTCIEDPEDVSELLVATGAGTARSQDPNGEWQLYSGIVGWVDSIVKSKGTSELGESNMDPQKARIILQLEASGVKTTQPNSYRKTLIASMVEREKNRAISNRNVFHPDKKLNRMKVEMANLEWYKKSVSENEGYYDSYKNKRFPQDRDVIKYKKRLNKYWEKVVDEAETRPHRQNAPLSVRWLYGGTNYRRMIEPLDIADYYSKGLKEYKTNGRSQHHKKLEEWLNESHEATGKPFNPKKQNVSDILTEDSCFWANVEEASNLCKSLRNGVEGELSRKNLVKFEEYVISQIKSYAVSPQIFLERSSFMQWWKDYEVIIGSSHKTEFTEFMKNGRYDKYANGSLSF